MPRLRVMEPGSRRLLESTEPAPEPIPARPSAGMHTEGSHNSNNSSEEEQSHSCEDNDDDGSTATESSDENDAFTPGENSGL